MSASLVVTLVGPDRPGVVERISEGIAAAEGNWEESRMARLAGHFAGILRVTVDAAQTTMLQEALTTRLAEIGISVSIHDSTTAADQEEEGNLCIELIGNDHPGIVKEISKTLAARGVNIEELTTWTESAPMAGGVLFRATALVRASESVLAAGLRADLEQIASELMVELSFAGSDD